MKNWTALQMLVSNSAAGQQSQAIADWLVEVTVQWFKDNANLTPAEVAGFLEDIVVHEFNVEVEDGSYDEVGRELCKMYDICTKGIEEEILTHLKKLPKCDLSQCQVQNGDESMDDVEDAINEVSESMAGLSSSQTNGESSGTSSNRPQTDEDGWTIVTSRKKK